MAVTFYEFNKYWIEQYTEDVTERTARIGCQMGNDVKGYLNFYKDGVSVPASRKVSYDRLSLNFNEHRFRDIAETLRLEKPLYLYFNDVTVKGWITTWAEPVGEEEAT